LQALANGLCPAKGPWIEGIELIELIKLIELATFAPPATRKIIA
jgi:hypothetical protein